MKRISRILLMVTVVVLLYYVNINYLMQERDARGLVGDAQIRADDDNRHTLANRHAGGGVVEGEPGRVGTKGGVGGNEKDNGGGRNDDNSGVMDKESVLYIGGGMDNKETVEKEERKEEKQEKDSHKPLFVLVLSSLPRSGSTLMSEALSMLPESVLFFEPLWVQQGSDCINNGTCTSAFLRGIFECQYSEDFESWWKKKKVFFHFYHEQVRRCLDGPKEELAHCRSLLNLREMCHGSSVRVMKVIRAKLEYVADLLNDSTINLKVIYLTRDPRGSLNSIRRFKAWNKDPKDRCGTLEYDLITYDLLTTSAPSKLLHVKLEDFCIQPHQVMSRILTFLFHDPAIPQRLKDYLDQHTTADKARKTAMGTFKNSKDEYQAWRTKIDEKTLKAAESEPSCVAAIQKMGFNVFGSKDKAMNLSLPLMVT